MTTQAINSRKSFILHKDSLDILDKLSDEQAGKLFKSIHFYQKKQEIPELDFALDLVFTSFLNQFKRDDGNYKITCEARKLAGSKGGKQKVANASKCKQKVANLADNKSESKSESKNKNVNVNLECKSQLDSFCDDITKSLKNIIENKLSRKVSSNGWQKQIKLTIKDLAVRGEEKAKQDIIKCIQAIEDHFGKDYFPVIQSASSLREKFAKIENYLAKTPENKKNNIEGELKQIESKLKQIDPLADIKIKDKNIIIILSTFESLMLNKGIINKELTPLCNNIGYTTQLTNN
jgi:hypothetical protein